MFKEFACRKLPVLFIFMRILAILFIGLVSLISSFVTAESYYGATHYCRLDADSEKSAHPVRHYAPSKQIDVEHLKLEVTPDFQSRTVTGTVRIEFSPIARALDELSLDAVDLYIDSVTSSAAIEDYQNNGEQLIITFKKPIEAGKDSYVEVSYSAEPEIGLYFRTPEMGYQEGEAHIWTQGEMHEHRHWFPCYDYPNERFTSELIANVPEGMVALSSGRLVSEKKDSKTELVAWHWKQDQPHVNYLITLCAGNFEKIEDSYRDIPMAFWMPPSRMEHAEIYFDGTKKMMKFFEDYIGIEYPWDKYDQVVVEDFN